MALPPRHVLMMTVGVELDSFKRGYSVTANHPSETVPVLFFSQFLFLFAEIFFTKKIIFASKMSFFLT